jgi:excisionase family DNA binding protein
LKSLLYASSLLIMIKKKPKKILEASGMDDLVSISQAAELRGVSHAAIQDLIKRGRLAPVEVAGRRLLRRGDVQGFQRASKGGRGNRASE